MSKRDKKKRDIKLENTNVKPSHTKVPLVREEKRGEVLFLKS